MDCLLKIYLKNLSFIRGNQKDSKNHKKNKYLSHLKAYKLCLRKV